MKETLKDALQDAPLLASHPHSVEEVDYGLASASEIGSLVAAGEDLMRQRAALQTRMDAVVGRMAAMNAAPGGCPQARPGTALATLCQENRDLLTTANRVVSQYNDTVARQNALVDEHGRLRTATTQLIDAYNWTW